MGIVLGFGLIFALTGIVLFINSMESVSNRVKQLLGCILGTLVFMSFGFVGLWAKGLGIMRLFLLFFGGIGVLLLIQGIRNFIKGESDDVVQTSGYNSQYGEYNVSPDTTVSPDITAHMVCMAANPQT